MSNSSFPHRRVRLTSRHLERDGTPVIPVSGEIHYSRVPCAQWRERLELMRAGGITVVATYAFWLHHEEVRGTTRFDSDLDVRAFVELCASVGLDVVLRIGPWCHGEVRNGGFPDWVQAAPVVHRTDDPAYLALVAGWFAALGEQLADLCGRDSPIIGIQLENELYDQPGHIATIKRMAIEHGLTAPIWTATAWGGALLPDGEVLPLFGGYGDGFWVDADAPWDATFREHFFFSRVWDDPGIGADLRTDGSPAGARTPSASFPPATCELGGGMATAYHRRPWPSALDIAAVAHNKIGNGSVWQGYYMFAGGRNPPGLFGTQESHATGYPNDLPELDYDFHAPIGATGRTAASFGALRRQHAFLAAFGSRLAGMSSTLPVTMPTGVEDIETLRWALRSDGTAGFVFVTWHQPHNPLADYEAAQFHVQLDGATVVIPERPITIPPGTIAHWPVNLEIGGVLLAWATASALTILEGAGGVPVLVLTAEAGIEVRLSFGSGTSVALADPPGAGDAETMAGPQDVFVLGHPEEAVVVHARSDQGALDVLVVPYALAEHLWVLQADRGRELVECEDPIRIDADGRLVGRTAAARPVFGRFDPAVGAFVPGRTEFGADAAPVGVATVSLVREAAADVADSYGEVTGRASAPSSQVLAAQAARYLIELPAWVGIEPDGGELEITWSGDVARILAGDRVVADRFWDGSAWVVALTDLGAGAGTRLVLEILPLGRLARVHLPAAAEARRHPTEATISLDSVSLVRRRAWREAGMA